MQTHDIKDSHGRTCAFEINNFLVSRRRVCRILRTVPGLRILRTPRFLSYFNEDEFCEFELDGKKFTAWEPYGDNSRYWIGPEPMGWSEQVALVREAFVRQKDYRFW
jgi:hypothetical protein